MSFAITVKSVNISQQNRDLLINVYKNFNIKIVDVFVNQKSFTTICSSADDADNLCSIEVINVLRQAGMAPITSPQLKARRSVIAKKISNEILNSSEEIIKEELLRANDWAVNHIESAKKFHNLPFLKITFDSINMKEKCLKLGLNFRHLLIPDHLFENELFKEIKYCYRCYSVNTHIANKCSKPPDYKICSKCSATDHIWRNCTSNVVKCINCGGPHVTRSPSCPTRKDHLKIYQHPSPKFKLSEKDFPPLDKSYPQTNASKTREVNEPMTTIPKNFEKYAAVDIVYKTMTCFGIAHSNSAGDRNRFNKNMLNLLKENKIPIVYMNSIDIFLPSNPPSEALCLSEGDVSSTNLPSPSNLPSPTTPRRFSEVSATPKLPPPDTLNNAIDVPETSCAEFSTPTAEPIKRRNSTPKQKNTLANPRKKNLSEATSNPSPINVSSARRNLSEKKSTFTVCKIDSVLIRNKDELLKAVENRQAFIKNKKGLICTYNNYKAQLLKMKSLPEIISMNSAEFSKYLS